MDWDKIHTIQDLLDPTSSDNSEQYDTKRTEANELPFPPLRLTLEDSESNFPTAPPHELNLHFALLRPTNPFLNMLVPPIHCRGTS